MQPDNDRVIFRWQAVTYNTRLDAGGTRGENPVAFEIELRRDGMIQIRYGDGNTRVFPLVGISGRDGEPYVVPSHTSEFVLTNLTQARTITFSPRQAPQPASSDLAVIMDLLDDPVVPGTPLRYQLLAKNLGPDGADNVTMNVPVPEGTTFVSCFLLPPSRGRYVEVQIYNCGRQAI